MVISNYRLPQIERPTEKSLDDDDEKVLAAFEIVLSGYKKAQKRTRAITKAYNELESLALKILEDLKSKERQLGVIPVAENSSTAGRVARSEEAVRAKRPHREARAGGSIEMIDLTSLFASGRIERGVEKPSSQPSRGGPAESCPVGDEENEPPPGEGEPREPRTSAKVGLAKVIYRVDDVRATPQRRSRQSTLVLKPVARRSELSRSLEKPSPDKSRRRRRLCDDNLFDEDYRAKKKRESERATRLGVTSGADEPEAIPSDSQINETARSLFDDEDPDNFQISPDILNTCAESSALEVVEEPRGPKHPADFANGPASVDETFFAPAELVADTSRGQPLRSVDENVDGARGGKRKSPEEANDETGEIKNLALQDINWDAEMSDDDWNSSAERAPHDSFHLPPEKKKKSPQYAYKEGVERNKAKRSKLRGWNCWQCEQYYEKMQLPEEELRKRMDACSRHRGKFNPRYCTPKDFWNPVFPDSTDSSDCSQN